MRRRVEPSRAGLAIVTAVAMVAAMMLLFGSAPALGQQENQVCPEHVDGWSSHFDDGPHTETGEWGQIQMSGETEEDELLTATINEGYVVEICVKQATDTQINQYAEGSHTVWEGDLSHWSYRVVEVPEEEPELAAVSVTGECVENQFVVTVSSSNASVNVDLNADGDFADANETNTADGNYTILAAAGGTIQWNATADSGAEFEGGETTDSGSLSILDCEEPGPETGTIVVVKQVAEGDPQDVAFTFNATGFTLSDNTLAHNESVSAEVAAGGDYSVSETVLAGWELVSATCDATDEADDSTPADINVSAGETVTCTFLNQIEDEVAGTTITTSTTSTTAPVVQVTTTIPDEVLDTGVEAEELPFTGIDSELLVGMALLVLISGLLVLGLTGSREDV